MAAPLIPEGTCKVEMTIEPLEELQGIDFENTPPCTVKRKPTGKWETCGQPSVARIHCTCPCGYDNFSFACTECLAVIRAWPQLSVCKGCWEEGTLTVKDA